MTLHCLLTLLYLAQFHSYQSRIHLLFHILAVTSLLEVSHLDLDHLILQNNLSFLLLLWMLLVLKVICAVLDVESLCDVLGSSSGSKLLHPIQLLGVYRVQLYIRPRILLLLYSTLHIWKLSVFVLHIFLHQAFSALDGVDQTRVVLAQLCSVLFGRYHGAGSTVGLVDLVVRIIEGTIRLASLPRILLCSLSLCLSCSWIKNRL